jgi:succinate-semialdehyde dehydrogenase/glutarate-semialdehyde dehydrogenase
MQTNLLIGGAWTEGSEGERITVLDPATGESLADVAAGTPADASRAVDVAAEAQRGWAATAPRVRSEILRAAWESMVDHSDEIAGLIVREHGKPLADAAGEAAYAAEFFRWNAEETVRLHGSIGTSPSGDKKMIVQHPPMGVVVMVTPWNFPAAMITRKLAPALGAGNAVVIKPPREAPLTALRIGQLLEDVGLPPGLVNIVATTSSGAWFDAAVDNRHTRMVSFTGSTEVGKVLLRRCADRVLKTVMELGGNAPFIVFDDADVEAAAEGAMVAKMRHSAETCTAANRFYVEAGIADDYTQALADAMRQVKLGSGFDEGVTCGPMINAGAVASSRGAGAPSGETSASAWRSISTCDSSILAA